MNSTETTLKPGYYMFKPLGYPVEVAAGGEFLSMAGEQLDNDCDPSDLRPATLKDLIQWGGDFDDSKIIVGFVSWAASSDSEEWHHAADEDDAIGQAQDQDLDEIWISGKVKPADPRDVIPSAGWIVDHMLDSSDDDVSTFWAASELGWLDNVTKEQEADLDGILKTVICQWLIGHGHWPEGFVVSGASRKVEVKS